MIFKHRIRSRVYQLGFSIVELLVIIVVIAILASVIYFGYTGVQDRAREGVLRSDLTAAADVLKIDKVRSGSFPINKDMADRNSGLPASAGTTYQYSVNNSITPPSFCLTGTNGLVALHITQEGVVNDGVCAGHTGPVVGGGGGGGNIADGSYIQEINNGNCPTSRVRAVDARDNHTYWVQKLADGKCWMLTNLAYAGGGNNAYGDVKVLVSGTSSATTYTAPSYYIPVGANPTTEPAAPSTSTNGSGQFGYLYNWCAAMGGQLGTGACAFSFSPPPSEDASICPAGWRLPTGNDREYTALNTAINGGLASTDAGLRSSWLGQLGGYWFDGFGDQGVRAYYWSSTQHATGGAHYLYFTSSFTDPASRDDKAYGFAMRCVAS